jgi:hypothetical protein
VAAKRFFRLKDDGADAAIDDMLGKVERLNGTGQYANALSTLIEDIDELLTQEFP